MAVRTASTESSFDANLPAETKIVTAAGVRSARIRNKAQPGLAAKPKLKKIAKDKLKLVVEVIADDDDDDDEEYQKAPPAKGRKKAAAKAPAAPKRAKKAPAAGAKKKAAAKTAPEDAVPVEDPPVMPMVGMQYGPPKPDIPGPVTRPKRARVVAYADADDGKKSDASYHDQGPEDEEHEEEHEPLKDSIVNDANSRVLRRLGQRLGMLGLESGTSRVLRGLGQRSGMLGLESGQHQDATNKNKRKRAPPLPAKALDTILKRTFTRKLPPAFRVHSDPPSDGPSFTFHELSSKKAFWWAHILWILACFILALLLWTLALSLYWGNRFATIGPPAPCDMTTTTRPFPQTYSDSFKIFRRPDISWNPVVRQQMEEFGAYIGADPWLMDNCILPRNVMKLPLVTCQDRLPWYNLTVSQVMWLNEESQWAWNLDWDVTERFNGVFDMQFELQELQTSWMLSPLGPSSPVYPYKRCKACADMKGGEKREEQKQVVPVLPPGNWYPRPREKALLRKILPFRALRRLKGVLFGVGENPPVVDLVAAAVADVPYYKTLPSVGSDLKLTDTDTSAWWPATKEYFAMKKRQLKPE